MQSHAVEMTYPGATTAALAGITDEGFFERLATAVLREANPLYATLVHPGVNAEGKTIKGPLDGIALVTGADPPHLIAAHHTTTLREGLHRKWLETESAVSAAARPAKTAGDLAKTAAIVSDERRRVPSLRATLILTTNQEPREDLVRAVHAAGLSYGISIDLWSRSRLAHFLDNDPQGQWLRRKYLGIEQERPSRELLRELSSASIELYRPRDQSTAWIEHGLDQAIASFNQRQVTFIVAESGLGKSVACYKYLVKHVAQGGIGLVLPHEILAAATTLDQALEGALRQLYPSLVPGCGGEARRYGSPIAPFLIVVEDINRSGQAPALAEKLARWSQISGEKGAHLQNWRILCPIWPHILAALDGQVSKSLEAHSIAGTVFTSREAREAVQRRAATRGVSLSAMDADAFASALGHDPLLIALNETNERPDAHRVIGDFVDSAISRVVVQRAEYTTTDYRRAVRALAREMLFRREIDPLWGAVTEWIGPRSESLAMLRHLVLDGQFMRLSGPAADQRLAFRHDRVRDQLFTWAAADIIRESNCGAPVLSDPYFAEIIGRALAREPIELHIIDEMVECNPLALFHALRAVEAQNVQLRIAVVAAIDRWLDAPTSRATANQHLSWHALAALSEIESEEIRRLVERFDERRAWVGLRARFRNGDVTAGIALCYSLDPGLASPWRDQQIEHARSRIGDDLIATLGKMLRERTLDAKVRVGALRLAGHLADSRFAPAIEASWVDDPDRKDNLAEYLWASAQCCGNDPARLLAPVCDAWAALPDEVEEKGHSSPRNSVAAHAVRSGFRQSPPLEAIPYFIARAGSEGLRWPITYMLYGIDHPTVQLFIVRELAAMYRKVEGTRGFSPFAHTVTREWDRRQLGGRPMSQESRAALMPLWQDSVGDPHVRQAAFSVWSATEVDGDLPILRKVAASDALSDLALRQRILRGDQSVIAVLLEKISTQPDEYWWFLARHIWSPDMTSTLDEEFTRRRDRMAPDWGSLVDHDWILSELLMERTIDIAEPILLKHWDHLRFSPYYVQAALYFASPLLRRLAREAIDAAHEPKKMLEHIDHHFGFKVAGRKGVTRRDQLEAIVPYIHLLEKLTILSFWEVCNDHGWFDLRRQHFDALITDGREAEYVHRQNTFAALDRMASDRHRWSDHWFDGFLKTGISHEAAIALLGEWLSNRKTIPVLRVVAEALVHVGRRADLPVLSTDVIDHASEAEAIIADTTFAIRRKTLH